jgi:hypothetical protein
VSQKPASARAAACTPTRARSKIRAIGVVILARNHADTIAKCIQSLFAANSYAGWRNSLWIVVVADSCTDDTARIAREAIGSFGQVLEVCAHSRQAGLKVGAVAVMEHFGDVPRHTLLLSSMDATADLPQEWIDSQVKSSQAPIGLASNNRTVIALPPSEPDDGGDALRNQKVRPEDLRSR